MVQSGLTFLHENVIKKREIIPTTREFKYIQNFIFQTMYSDTLVYFAK